MDETFLQETVETWQRHYAYPLTREDARQMVENTTGFFKTIKQWADAQAHREDARGDLKGTPSASGDPRGGVSPVEPGCHELEIDIATVRQSAVSCSE